MSYMALYRKFRPQNFDDVKGQDHIVTALQNQIKADRLGHAYLFTGTRGTGKTTVAKILAKAVNCENPVNGSPCNCCPSCQRINEGTSMNVFEIDAASNNGVQNIRDIIDEVAYAPTEGRYKVYIIDEVHMLSTGAFNAMLKTLEEPPEYVIFILATTEVHKIPITILSRCQRYDFRRISIDTIADRLKELMVKENVPVEDKALRYVAKAGDGSMRDSLSLLDQCIAFYLGEELTYDKVLTVLGAVDNDIFSKLLRTLYNRDVTGAIAQLEEMVTQGRDLHQFVVDFTWYMRNLLLVKSDSNMEDVLEVTSEQMAALREEAEMMDDVMLMRFIREFSELSNQIKYSSQKRVLIEIALVKLCRPEMEQDNEALIDRINAVETKLDQGFRAAPVNTSVPGADKKSVKVEKEPLPEALPEEVEALLGKWKQVVAACGGMLKTVLKDEGTMVTYEGGKVKIVVDEIPGTKSVNADILKDEMWMDELHHIIEELTGKHVDIILDNNDTGMPGKKLHTDAVEEFAKRANLEIETEDF